MCKTILVIFLFLAKNAWALESLAFNEFLDKSEQGCCENLLENEVKEFITTMCNFNKTIELLNDRKKDVIDEIQNAIQSKIDSLIPPEPVITTTTLKSFNSEEDYDFQVDIYDPPDSCNDVYENVNITTGVYMIHPDNSEDSFKVFCNMELPDHRWLQILNRYDGSLNFDRPWEDYKNGFGELTGEQWLGLQRIYEITSSAYNEFLIEVVYANSTSEINHYKHIQIGNESTGYEIEIFDKIDGTEPLLFGNLEHKKFATFDHDNGLVKDRNCATESSSGWWFGNPCELNTPTSPFSFGNKEVDPNAEKPLFVGVDAVYKEVRAYVRKAVRLHDKK